MRASFSALAALLLVAGPAAISAGPAAAEDTVSMADARRYGEWMSQIMAADAERQKAFSAIMPQMNAAVARVRDRDSARAAAVELAALIGSARPKFATAQAAIRAMPPLPDPLDSRMPFPTKQLKADLLATGDRIDGLLDATIGLANAMAADDRAAATRHAKSLREGATLLIDGQLLLVRARRATLPETDSSNHALGLMDTLYNGMKLTMNQLFQPGEWPRARYLELADQAKMLSAKGRAALDAEWVEADRLPARSADDRRAKALEMQVLEMERETFEIGDALAQTLVGMSAASGQNSRALIQQLNAIESRIAEVSQKQAAAVAGTR